MYKSFRTENRLVGVIYTEYEYGEAVWQALHITVFKKVCGQNSKK